MMIHVESRSDDASPFRSLGEKEAAEGFANLLGRLAELKKNGELYSPKEKAKTLLETLAVTKGWCNIQHLGARRTLEEIEIRFESSLERKEPAFDIVYKGGCAPKIRLLPLFERNDLNDRLHGYGKSPSGDELYTYSLLFATIEGRVVEFEVVSKFKGAMIQFPHLLTVSIIEIERFGHLMTSRRTLLDECIQAITSAIGLAYGRAQARLETLHCALDAVRTIGHMQRKDDLTLQILLWNRKVSRLMSTDRRKDGFRKIVAMLGPTYDERVEKLNDELKKLGWDGGLSMISGLSASETLAILQEPVS